MRIVSEATEHVHIGFIHVENKGCQMKGKRNHSKMTANEREERENGPMEKEFLFLFDLKKCPQHSVPNSILV